MTHRQRRPIPDLPSRAPAADPARRTSPQLPGLGGGTKMPVSSHERAAMHAPPELRVHRSVFKALRLFDADRFRWLDEAASIGPVVALRMGPVKVWAVSDAEVARTMLVAESSSWKRPPAALAPIRVGVGENLFTQADKAWAHLQPLVAPSFRKRALDARLAEVNAVIEEEVAAIPRNTTIDLELAMGRNALVLAAWVLLGEQLDRSRAEEIAHHRRRSGPIGRRPTRQVLRLHSGRARRTGTSDEHHRAVLNAYADEVIARDHRRCALVGARTRCSHTRRVGRGSRGARSSHRAIPHRNIAADSRGLGDPADTDQGRSHADRRGRDRPRSPGRSRHRLPTRHQPLTRTSGLTRCASSRPDMRARQRNGRVHCFRSGSVRGVASASISPWPK